MADLCLECGEYIGQNEENSPYCKCKRYEIRELEVKANNLDYIIQSKKTSKNLVRFILFATGSELFDRLFQDEEFKKHWYLMLRRLEFLERESEHNNPI